MIKINEIFYSIQGESSYMGFPCIFIRVSGCNLRCSYCDTEYAYTQGKNYNIDEVLTKVGSYECNLVEITGGEPLMQEDAFLLIDKLIDSGYKVLVETNGTIDISNLSKEAVIIMDIKSPSSNESDKILLENINILKSNDEIKFVISDNKDYIWAKDIIDRFKLGKRKVLFSPVFGKLDPLKLSKWILNDNLNARLQVQLHKLIKLKS